MNRTRIVVGIILTLLIFVTGIVTAAGQNAGAAGKPLKITRYAQRGVPATCERIGCRVARCGEDVLEELGYRVPTTLVQPEVVFEAYTALNPDRYALSGRGKTTWQGFGPAYAFGTKGHISNAHNIHFDGFIESAHVAGLWKQLGQNSEHQ